MLTIVNTFPKSGTNLVKQMLDGALKFEGHVGMYDGPTGRAIPRKLIEQFVEDRVDSNGFITAHLHYWPDLSDIVDSCRMLFLIRDPRDVVVSHAHYVANTPSHSLHRVYHPTTWDEQVRMSIVGVGDTPDIGLRFLPYLPWMYQDIAWTRFEDLVSHMRLSCAWVADWIEQPEKTDAMLESIDPRTSPTFRQGRAGAWLEEMSAYNKELFDCTAGWLIKALNYAERIQEPA